PALIITTRSSCSRWIRSSISVPTPRARRFLKLWMDISSARACLPGGFIASKPLPYSRRSGRGVQGAVFAKQLVHHDGAGARHIQGMFEAEHRDTDVRVAISKKFCAQAIHFVAEQNADGEARLPIEDINGTQRGFD